MSFEKKVGQKFIDWKKSLKQKVAKKDAGSLVGA
jgi:hypothetical protein